MSCQKCDQYQDEEKETYYRWKNANIMMCGCPEHLREIFAVLSMCQKNHDIELLVLGKKEIKDILLENEIGEL